MKTTRKEFITALGGTLLVPSVALLKEDNKEYYTIAFTNKNDIKTYFNISDPFNLLGETEDKAQKLDELTAKRYFTNIIKAFHENNPPMRKVAKSISLYHYLNNEREVIRKAYIDEKVITEYDFDLASTILYCDKKVIKA